MRKVFGIIVTYNGSKWVDKCVESVLNSSLDLNVIVVDNKSNDDTCKKIREKFPQVSIIEIGSNVGFGQANNRGIRKAYELGATHFFLLNQDAWAERDTIEKLVTRQQENTEYGILSPMHFTSDGNELDLNFSNYIKSSKSSDLYSDLCLNKMKSIVYEVDHVNAAAWLLSRECIEKVGGFNPSFFQYGEDDNYIDRVHYYGFKAGVYPVATIFHDRENRLKTGYDGPLEKFKRRNLLKYSNPLEKHSIDSDRKRMMVLSILQILRGRLDTFKMVWNQHKILKEIGPSVKKNLVRSMEGGSLCFLNK